MEIRRTIKVSNSQGLHARPCHALVSAALEFQSEVRISLEGRNVNGKSILELMSLNAACGRELEIRVNGGDAEGLMAKLVGLFESGFGEAADS